MTVASAIKAVTNLPAGSRGQLAAELSLAHSGATSVSIRYELTGDAGDPVLVVAGGISAGRHVLANEVDPGEGWWQCQQRAFENYRLLSIDWIGSSGELDHPICPSDQARAILAVLDALDLDRLAFVGASYGAMVGMHLAALAPRRVSGLLSISAAHQAHPFSSAWRALQRQAIELGERAGHPGEGVALARKLAILSYRTPQEFAERFESELTIKENRATADAESYLDHMGERHSRRMAPAAYRRLSESIDLHRIDPSRIAVPATFVGVESDQLVPIVDVEQLARKAPRARFFAIPSLYGHDAFLKEEGAIAQFLANFLNSPEHHQ